MTQKCKICNRYFKTKKGLKIHETKMHGKQTQDVNVNNSQIMEKILNSIRKLQLDNVYLKCRVKNITGNNNTSNDSKLNWNLKPEVQKAKDETKVDFSGVVEEMKKVFKPGFNYRDILTHVGNVETILIPIMVAI